MPFRYPHLCPVARACELLANRWSLLILRDLFLGPQRFTDLRARLRGISSSVLAERLRFLEEEGLVTSRPLPPPAASSVYELAPDGRAFWPALREIARWGTRFMVRGAREGDHFEPDWVRLAALLFAATHETPDLRITFRVAQGGRRPDVVFRASGGPAGTRIDFDEGESDAELRAAPQLLLGVLSGALDPVAGGVEVAGDASAARRTARLFDLDTVGAEAPATPPSVH